MSNKMRSRLGCLTLLLSIVGCGGNEMSVADQFKLISDQKQTQLSRFLESKQSRLASYIPTVTEEADVDQRADHTHVGMISFTYAVTQPQRSLLNLEGEDDLSQMTQAATAVYHFSAKSKKWIYQRIEHDKSLNHPAY